MSKLITRGAVLTASRLSNFAVQAFSPVLLVRILDVNSYGQYQEFMIYAALLTVVAEFAVDSSLTYFLPRYPGREKAFITQTTLVTFALAILCVIGVIAFGPMIRAATSYDFIAPLAAYIVFFVSMNWIEYYWIANGNAIAVMAYSFVRLVLRISVLVAAAYVTGDVVSILWSLVAFEALKTLVTMAYFSKLGVFTTDLRRSELFDQLKFALPVGSSALTQQAGRNIGKIFIASSLGPIALAYYAVGSYLLPIVRALRSGITDAIYPELVRSHGNQEAAVKLWQRVNVLNCVIFFPSFAIILLFASDIIAILFTRTYLPAVPVFIVLALFLIRRCFNSDVLLRTTGRTGFMLFGTVGALTINVSLIALLSKMFGLIGPAVAFLISEVMLEIYYLIRSSSAMNLSMGQLVDWRSIGRVALSCVIASPILLVGDWFITSSLIKLVVLVPTYFAIVLLVAFHLGVSDIGRLANFIAKQPRRLAARKNRR
jgi:O-antigen/teichoic acid export membrane protein